MLASIPLLILSTAANFQPTIIVILNLWLLGVGIFIRSSSYTAAASLRKRKSFGASIETGNMRGMGSKNGGGEGSLNKFPMVYFIICVLLWLLIYVFLK